MRCSSDVLKKTSPLDVFGDVSEKVKHLTNDASNDVSPPALPTDPQMHTGYLQVAAVRDGIEQTRNWLNERPRSRNSDVDQLSSEFLPLVNQRHSHRASFEGSRSFTRLV